MAKTCRVLVTLYLEGQTYEPNSVIELSDKQAKALEKEGSVDTTREAVLYCTNDLGAAVTRHEPAEVTVDAQASVSVTSADAVTPG